MRKEASDQFVRLTKLTQRGPHHVCTQWFAIPLHQVRGNRPMRRPRRRTIRRRTLNDRQLRADPCGVRAREMVNGWHGAISEPQKSHPPQPPHSNFPRLTIRKSYTSANCFASNFSMAFNFATSGFGSSIASAPSRSNLFAKMSFKFALAFRA